MRESSSASSNLGPSIERNSRSSSLSSASELIRTREELNARSDNSDTDELCLSDCAFVIRKGKGGSTLCKYGEDCRY